MSFKLQPTTQILTVLSGKGGVGKSSVSIGLSLSLVSLGYKVAILDLDLCGPSIPYLLNVEDQTIYQTETGWLPVKVNGSNKLSCMSIAFLLKDRNQSVVWRGPKKTAMVKQFFTEVNWGDIDYLIIDTPPGTSDEHLTVVEVLKEFENQSSILVTTPQEVATLDVKKEINFCKKVGLPIVGIVENLSGYICPNCADCANLFSKGGGIKLADQYQLKFLGSVPIDPTFTELLGASQHGPIIEKFSSCNLFPYFKAIGEKSVESCNNGVITTQ